MAYEIDFDGDGRPDAIGYDTTGDGRVDTIKLIIGAYPDATYTMDVVSFPSGNAA